MKKYLMMAAAFLVLGCSSVSGDDKPISVEQLPANAKQFITTYFSGVKVAFSTMDNEFMDSKTYDVVFSDGRKVEFDKNGDWKDVDCKSTAIPTGIVPTQIVEYVKANYPDTFITDIDRDRHDYEIKLSNRLEIKFNKQFQVIGYDD